MKSKYVIAILCAFVIIISSVGTYASLQVKEDNEKDEGLIVTDLKNGVFSAKLGIGKNEDPIYSLNGNYQKEDKIVSCDGTVINGYKEGKFTGIFKGEYFEIKITVEEKPIIISGKLKLDKNKEDFNGEWYTDCKDGGGKDKTKCFDFVYPISYTMPDGSTITVETEDDWNGIKNWYESNPGVKEKTELQYPVDIIFEDDTIKTINNEKEMNGAYKYCWEKDTGWIKGTFQGMVDGKEIVIYQKDGIFTASLGIKGNKRPLLNLEGTYHRRGRSIIIQGREDNRFSGAFRGGNFIIRTQLRGEARAQIVYGLTRFDENYNSFTGIWSSRGLSSGNWISGSFN